MRQPLRYWWRNSWDRLTIDKLLLLWSRTVNHFYVVLCAVVDYWFKEEDLYRTSSLLVVGQGMVLN